MVVSRALNKPIGLEVHTHDECVAGIGCVSWLGGNAVRLHQLGELERAGLEAKLGFKAHPHMLRHACGYALANRGHDTRALQGYPGTATSSTRRYSEMSPTRFKEFWRHSR